MPFPIRLLHEPRFFQLSSELDRVCRNLPLARVDTFESKERTIRARPPSAFNYSVDELNIETEKSVELALSCTISFRTGC
jgi:hypothetical protein